MTWGERPLITASAVTMIRWASDRDGQRLHVVGDHVVALVGGRHSPRRPQEHDGRARAGAQVHVGVVAGGLDESTM